MIYTVFYGGSFGRQIKEQKKGYFKQYSSFHGACAINCDPETIKLWDRVEKIQVKLKTEAVKWETQTMLSKRKYPKNTLIWGSLWDNNPYVIFIPCASFEEAVKMVKLMEFPEPGRFTIAEYIKYKKSFGWSEYDYTEWHELFDTPWMDSSVLPQRIEKYINGGQYFQSMEEAQKNQESRWQTRPDGARSDWNTILTERTWIL